MIELPKKVIKSETKSPKRLVLYSQPKMGKTTAISKLDNCLIVDFEDGSDFIDGYKVKINNVSELKELMVALKEAKDESNNEKPYKFIVLDTVTQLETLVIPIANEMFCKTPMGKGMINKGKWKSTDNVLTLPEGAGYYYLREAFEKVYTYFNDYCDHLIMLGHIKDVIDIKRGKDVASKEIDLTGKIKRIVCQNADAIGYFFRDRDGVYISFNTSEGVVCGSRPLHLSNKEIKLAEISDNPAEENYNWDKIFID